MIRCPRCSRGRMLLDDDNCLVCHLCGEMRDDYVSLLDKVLSNATPDAEPGIGPRQTPPVDWARVYVATEGVR
jgi:ferredoxin